MITALISLMAAENLLLNEPKTPSLPEPNIIVAAYPERTGKSIKPIIEAKSVLSLDLETGKVLFENGPDQELPMASLTKLMTALVILDNHDLNEIVTIDKRATQVEPAKIYLKAGEQFTIRDLFKGLFIKSANDVALALAYHDSQDLDTFVEKMNKKAQEIGLKNTQFKNPTGLDLEGQYSTANDLAILARLVYRHDIVQKITPIKETEISAINTGENKKLTTTNELLGSYLKVLGLKTGTTDLAGQCLITVVENDQGKKILNIVLNSPARFTESKILSQWIFDNYQWI